MKRNATVLSPSTISLAAVKPEGEGVERNWKELNSHALSTAEMTPGHHWEMLDYCCGWLNFRKTMGLGVWIHILFYIANADASIGELLLLVTMAEAMKAHWDFVDLGEWAIASHGRLLVPFWEMAVGHTLPIAATPLLYWIARQFMTGAIPISLGA